MSETRIDGVEIRRLALPLIVPYRLSYITFEVFEPFLVRLRSDDGRLAFGEGHISPGSSRETREGGWSFLRERVPSLLGSECARAIAHIETASCSSPVAASSVLTALEMLAGHPLLEVDERAMLPLLTPTNAEQPDDIAQEVETRLAEGFRTFKIKVGKSVRTDLMRVERYQHAVAGRATLRLDANRAFDAAEGCEFAAALDPSGIELFEQPCASEDWDANAEVARRSNVPLMLDEPICSIDDVERAARIPNVRYCKVKLKRFGRIGALDAVLTRIRALGLEPVLGDGLGCEPACWMEACVARSHIRNAGEFNGFLKPRDRLFASPLKLESGAVVLEPGEPLIDAAALASHTVERISYGSLKESPR